MTDYVRVLNEDGIEGFRAFLQRLRDGAKELPPMWLLTESSTSKAMPTNVELERKTFASRFDFGQYLSATLESLGRRSISHHFALWTWLSLYYFDE